MARKDEQKQKQQEEARRIQEERAQGTANLEAHNAAEVVKSDEERAADDKLAQEQQEEAAAAERERAEAEQKKAGEVEAQIPEEAQDPNIRAVAGGTKVLLNGVECEVVGDAVLKSEGFASEQHYASVLAHDPKNFALNAPRLRLVYNPMNATPAPLDEQRLSLEEMTEAEAAIFAPPPPRPSRK